MAMLRVKEMKEIKEPEFLCRVSVLCAMAIPVSLLKEGKRTISTSQVKLEDLQENGLEKVPCVP